MKFSIEDIKDLMDKMQSTGLGELELHDGDYKLKLSAKKEQKAVIHTVMDGATATPVAVPTVAPTTAPEVAAPDVPQGTVIKAPIVGTYYSAPAPDKAPFIQIGQKVQKGDVLYIIESMKLMNEIQADQAGEVVEILVSNGDAVEYDQPILVLK